MAQGRGSFFRLANAAALLSFFLSVPAPRAADLELSGSLSPGHDSNPAQSHTSEPSLAFAHYTLSALRRTRFDDSELELAVLGWYRDYEGSNDSHRVSVGGEWSRGFEGGLGRLSIGADLSFYRDQLVPADERDEAALLLGYQRLLSARSEWGLSAELVRSAYRNPALPWAGRPGSGGSAPLSGAPAGGLSRRAGGPNGLPPRRPPVPDLPRRDDDLAAIGMDTTYHWSPVFTTSLRLRLARSSSTLRLESYERYGAGLTLAGEPAADWRAGLVLDWDRLSYETYQGIPQRDDKLFFSEAFVSRNVGDGELFCRLRYVHNASSVVEKSFDQTVTRCGVAWDF